MAHKIGVLDAHSQEIREYVKKTVALLLIRRLLADWEIENVTIRRRALGRQPSQLPREPLAVAAVYIPAKLAPAELPECKATGPLANLADRGAKARFANLFAEQRSFEIAAIEARAQA